MIFQFDEGAIPITGLTTVPHFILFGLWGILGSILFVFLFPRIFCPVFLKIKNKVRWRYDDAYINIKPRPFLKIKLLKRAIYLFLLALGLLAFILPMIDPNQWLPANYGVSYYEGELGIPARYVLTLLGSIVLLITPFVVGLWSVAWVMEDAGLMHYKFDERKGRELYEIEPIHINYSSYLKGYAGISSIFFLIQVITAWAAVSVEQRISDVIGSALLPLNILVIALPAYFIYAKYGIKAKFLKKDLRELRKLSEEDILKE